MDGTDSDYVTYSAKVNETAVSPTLTYNQGTGVMVNTGDVLDQVLLGYADEGYAGAKIEQNISVEFPNYTEKFPSQPEGTTYGVNVGVSTNISYDQDDIMYSGKKKTYTDGTRYHVEKSNSATLNYEANAERDEYDSVGNASYNRSRLGNNGLDRYLTCKWPDGSQGMPINATAKYNANAVTNYDDATTVVYTLTLEKKTDVKEGDVVTKVEYQPVEIDKYLKNVKLFGGNPSVPLNNQSSDNKRYVYSEPKSSARVDEKMFTIDTYYEVLTGPEFHDYANYRVVLEVQLRSSSGGVISNSTQKDHIVYTNAKIHPEVIQR